MERILVVHPDGEELRTMMVALRDAGFQVLETSEQKSNLKYLRHQRPQELVVLVDDSREGSELCSWIRCASDTPIVALCGRRDERTRTKMFELGADACMSLYGGPSELVARVRSLLWRHRRTCSPEGGNGGVRDRNEREVRICTDDWACFG